MPPRAGVGRSAPRRGWQGTASTAPIRGGFGCRVAWSAGQSQQYQNFSPELCLRFASGTGQFRPTRVQIPPLRWEQPGGGILAARLTGPGSKVAGRTRVYLTIDTESSMGGAWQDSALRPVPADRRIFCRILGRDHGIGWQCEQLRERGLKATFFCEVLSSLVLGEEDSRSYLEFLLEQGQDVQLHVHPNFYFYAEKLWAEAQGLEYFPPRRPDALSSLQAEEQATILLTAVEVFRYLTGRQPSAFRAGNYQASATTLAILSQLGFRIDSSYNPVYRTTGSFSGETLPSNRPFVLEGVLELPVTVVRQQLPAPNKPGGLVQMEVCALSAAEMQSSLDQLQRAGAGDVVIVHHSFACVKARDAQYTDLRPDGIVMRRFTALLDYLAANSDRFEVTTMGALADAESPSSLETSDSIPSLGYFKPLVRTFQQAVNQIL